MDRREIAALLAYMGRLDHRITRTGEGEALAQIDQWHELLSDVPMATPYGWDARLAAKQHNRLSHYPILPADIARPWEAYRRDRIGRHTDPTPSVDPDDPAAWTAELLDTRRAVAHGEAQPTTARAITSGKMESEQDARLREIGSPIPPQARHALAQWRPARAAREAAIAQGQPDPLGIPCDICKAEVGRPCHRRRIDRNGQPRGSVPMSSPHPSRSEHAAARHAESVQQPALA